MNEFTKEKEQDSKFEGHLTDIINYIGILKLSDINSNQRKKLVLWTKKLIAELADKGSNSYGGNNYYFKDAAILIKHIFSKESDKEKRWLNKYLPTAWEKVKEGRDTYLGSKNITPFIEELIG